MKIKLLFIITGVILTLPIYIWVVQAYAHSYEHKHYYQEILPTASPSAEIVPDVTESPTATPEATIVPTDTLTPTAGESGHIDEKPAIIIATPTLIPEVGWK